MLYMVDLYASILDMTTEVRLMNMIKIKGLANYTSLIIIKIAATK